MKRAFLAISFALLSLTTGTALAQAVTTTQTATAVGKASAEPNSTAREFKYLRGQSAAQRAGSSAAATETRKDVAPIEEEGPVDLREAYISALRGFEAGQPFDYAARSRAIEFVNAQRAGLPVAPGTPTRLIPLLSVPWLELGPSPIPNGQTTPVSPVSGRVTVIEVDPLDPNKVYVGTAQGGVYRSLNGGTTWTPMFDGSQSLSIGALALDSANGRLYVGTGEANGSADSFSGVGIYRIDNVNTVSATLVGPINPVRNYLDNLNAPQAVNVFTGRSIAKILIVPNDPTTLLVGIAGGVMGIGGDPPFGGAIPPLGLRGLYKLTSATSAPASVGVLRIGVRSGVGKEGCFDTPCTGNRNVNDMVFDPGDVTGNTLMLWLNGTSAANDGGIWRTTNALAATPTFAQSFATTSTSTSNGRGALAIYKQGANPAVVYTASGEPSTGTSCGSTATNQGALRVSTDGGLTFGAKLAGGGGFCGGQCFYDIALAVLPGATTATSDDTILLGGNTPGACSRMQATSTDGGATFVNHDAGVHADSHAITIAPSNPLIVYRGDDGGIWKSVDGGTTWASLNNATFRATQFSGLSVHPTDPNFTIGGTQDNGTNQLLASGTAWNRVDFGDGGFALIDQSASNITTDVTMYHTYFNQTNNLIGFGRVLSTACASEGLWAFKGIYGGAVDPTPNCDGSDTFNGIGLADTVNFYAPMALGPGNPNTVYFGTNKLYRSANKGDTMPAVSQALGSNVSSIAVSPQDDNYRLVGLNNGGLFYTTTGANPLTDLDLTNAIPNKYVGRVVFDPNDKNTAYIGLGGYMASLTAANSHVWKITSLNTTPVLTGINGSGLTGLPDVPVNALAVDPNLSTRLFVGTDIGVFVSEDAGGTWAPFGTGLPNVAVFGMEIQNVKRVLRIATHGRGMWEIALTSVGVAPVITLNPTNAPEPPGAVATYTAAASGAPTPTVKWQRSTDGSTFIDIIGATSTTLTVQSATTPNIYQYRAVFTNGSGVATTTATRLPRRR